MQAQAVVHAGTGGNMMNQMATFCLGRGCILSGIGQVQVTRHKRPGTSDYELLLIMHLLSDLCPL